MAAREQREHHLGRMTGRWRIVSGTPSATRRLAAWESRCGEAAGRAENCLDAHRPHKRTAGCRRLVKQVSSTTPLELEFAPGSVRAWRHTVADRILVLQTLTARDMKNATILLLAGPAPPRPEGTIDMPCRIASMLATTRCGPAGASRTTKRPSAADRLVRVIGDLEADVNNGGFDQYLSNKGRPQARRAAKCLRSIGARRTGRLLESALRLHRIHFGLAPGPGILPVLRGPAEPCHAPSGEAWTGGCPTSGCR